MKRIVELLASCKWRPREGVGELNSFGFPVIKGKGCTLPRLTFTVVKLTSANLEAAMRQDNQCEARKHRAGSQFLAKDVTCR